MNRVANDVAIEESIPPTEPTPSVGHNEARARGYLRAHFGMGEGEALDEPKVKALAAAFRGVAEESRSSGRDRSRADAGATLDAIARERDELFMIVSVLFFCVRPMCGECNRPATRAATPALSTTPRHLCDEHTPDGQWTIEDLPYAPVLRAAESYLFTSELTEPE